MKSDSILASFLAAAAHACISSTHAFQIHHHHHHHHVSPSSSFIASTSTSKSTSTFTTTALYAKKKKKKPIKKNSNNNNGKGFAPKYSIADKSYGIITPSITDNSVSFSAEEEQPTSEETQSSSSMSEFFATYEEWKPLFRHIMMSPSSGADDFVDTASSSTSPLASSYLTDVVPSSSESLWGISTLEHKNPWRLLESKPTTNSSLEVLSEFLDEWQRSLLDIPLDEIVTGVNDAHFLEEGRRVLAVTRFHVLDVGDDGDDAVEGDDAGKCDWETELFRTVWSELAHLTSQNEIDTGSLVLLPKSIATASSSSSGEEDDEEEEGGSSSRDLEYVRTFVERKVLRPIRWLGRHEDWEIVAMERGSIGVRILYKLSDIPDLKDRDAGGDESVLF